MLFIFCASVKSVGAVESSGGFFALAIAFFAVAIFAVLRVDLLSFGERRCTRGDGVFQLFGPGNRHPVAHRNKQRDATHAENSNQREHRQPVRPSFSWSVHFETVYQSNSNNGHAAFILLWKSFQEPIHFPDLGMAAERFIRAIHGVGCRARRTAIKTMTSMITT